MENENGRTYVPPSVETIIKAKKMLGDRLGHMPVMIIGPGNLDHVVRAFAARAIPAMQFASVGMAELASSIRIMRSPFPIEKLEYRQIRFSPSRKRRVQKKWRNNLNNWGHKKTEQAMIIDSEHLDPFAYGISGTYGKTELMSDGTRLVREFDLTSVSIIDARHRV